MKKRLLSVIVPAYRQERTITKDLSNIKSVLEQLRYDYELICVVDGMVDKTFEKAKAIESSKLRIVGYEQNHGKGYALRYGIARSKGHLIAFIDSGMEINPNGISMVLEHMEWYGADIIVGSKLHPASQVDYPPIRRIVSFLYQLFVRIFTGLNVRDTQAGLKICKRQVLVDVLPRLLVKRYAFDLELLLVARHLGYKKIYEAPIKLSYKVKDLTHAVNFKEFFRPNGLFGSFLDTLAILYRLKVLHYYDNKNRRRWIYDRDLYMRVNVG